MYKANVQANDSMEKILCSQNSLGKSGVELLKSKEYGQALKKFLFNRKWTGLMKTGQSKV